MKKENLYIVGAAFLASTSLTSVATAATFALVNSGTTAQSGGTGFFSATARPLSAQAFAATPVASQVLGPSSLYIRFASPLQSNGVAVTATLAGARFVTSSVPSVATPLVVSTGTTSITANFGESATCSIQALTDKLIITGCNFGTSVATVSVSGLVITSISFDNATGLATAGTSVTLATDVTIGSTTIETTAATAIITSRNSITGTSTSNASIGQANVSASVPFASVVGSGLSAVIGTINITRAGAVAADLSTAIAGANGVGANTEVRITSTLLGGAGFVNARLAATTAPVLTRSLTQIASGSVTFAIVNAASVTDEFTVAVEFNGTTAIDTAAAGTTLTTFASAGAQSQAANSGIPTAISGTVAGISRSGLSIDVNGVQPGTAQGATTYTSLLRIANTGTASGTVTVVVKNESSGATLGTYTSPSIPGGASLQVSAANIEAGAGITPSASVLYRMTVSGSINGYVQHVNWNQTAGFFSDLSARRSGTVSP